MNPHAIPLEIEYIKIIMIIVMNPAAANTMSSQLTPFNCCAIMIPTTTNAGAVTAFVTVLNTSGDKKIDNKNKIPVVQAVRPVLPPTPTPEVDSTKLVTVLVPTIEPNTVPIASASKACSAFSNSPFSFTKPIRLPIATNVPAVSKKSTNKNEKITTNAWNGFANNSPKPVKKLQRLLIQKWADTGLEGSTGIPFIPIQPPNYT